MSGERSAVDSLGGRSLARLIVTIVWIAVKLILITAMLDKDVAQFVYAGF